MKTKPSLAERATNMLLGKEEAESFRQYDRMANRAKKLRKEGKTDTPAFKSLKHKIENWSGQKARARKGGVQR